mmetsp:Transcript_8991/g.21373  ORF Transcript_8991/g.21373 Transcript_8991/m.21373 type:complete len:296 (+) Transcript_8991:682-1569(+)
MKQKFAMAFKDDSSPGKHTQFAFQFSTCEPTFLVCGRELNYIPENGLHAVLLGVTYSQVNRDLRRAHLSKSTKQKHATILENMRGICGKKSSLGRQVYVHTLIRYSVEKMEEYYKTKNLLQACVRTDGDERNTLKGLCTFYAAMQDKKLRKTIDDMLQKQPLEVLRYLKTIYKSREIKEHCETILKNARIKVRDCGDRTRGDSVPKVELDQLSGGDLCNVLFWHLNKSLKFSEDKDTSKKRGKKDEDSGAARNTAIRRLAKAVKDIDSLKGEFANEECEKIQEIFSRSSFVNKNN